MSEGRWTPGPWGLTTTEDDSQWVLYSTTALRPGTRGAQDAGRYIGSDANATLIAAAPDLYEALRNILTAKDLAEVDWGAAHAALAKATASQNDISANESERHHERE